MPCNSDYLEPNAREAKLQLTAILYKYALKKMKLKAPANVTTAARDIYCTFDFVPDLCDLITKMDSVERRKVVYNPYDKTARKLADWWEEHQRADRERTKLDHAVKRSHKLRRSALKKLTPAEKKALRELGI
jgi:hypothetical protein